MLPNIAWGFEEETPAVSKPSPDTLSLVANANNVGQCCELLNNLVR